MSQLCSERRGFELSDNLDSHWLDCIPILDGCLSPVITASGGMISKRDVSNHVCDPWLDTGTNELSGHSRLPKGA